MDREERPSKFQKLSHGASRESSPVKTQSQDDSTRDPAAEESDSHESAIIDVKDDLTAIDHNTQKSHPDGNIQDELQSKPLSKSQRRKLLRKQRWEEGRTARKIKRKEKAVEKRERKRAAKAAEVSNAQPSLPDLNTNAQNHDRKTRRNVQLPVTFVLDCGFDDLMNENERISLGSQITRCYSDNKNARLGAHLVVSSWGGSLKERFDNLLKRQHESWRGVRWLEGDFVEASKRAKEWMAGEESGELDGALLGRTNEDTSTENLKAKGEVIYLSSESNHTLNELRPYSTYIIGGLVDRNRHKGICYKRAMDQGIKTARLPIGEFLTMSSRKVLATNHVSEIMLKWLETGDWGEAFLQVMPKRKGGQLKEQGRPRKVKRDDHHSDDADSTEGSLQAGNVSPTGHHDATVANEIEEANPTTDTM